MLCQFSFQNFKSYKEETTFDFQAASIPEFSESLLGDSKDDRLLPVGVIYGPNGGGKTTLLQALSCLISTIVSPINALGKNRRNMILQQQMDCEPFLFDEESKKQPTTFEIFFRQEENIYRYRLALREEEIISESLHWRGVKGKKTGMVFERDHSEITLGPSLSKKSINRSVNPKMPYLSFLSINYDIPIIANVQRWFESCIIRNYAHPRTEHEVLITEDTPTKVQIIQALNDVGIDLTGYRFDEAENQFYTQRCINGNTYELEYSNESDGTKKLIVLLPIVLIALRRGSLMIVDELDAKLHPKLLRYVISLFKNPKLNTKGAQLLFTSHDLTTMKNTVFRRDEIWFAAANSKHESEIYSLYDIRREDNERVNSTAAYDKQYLEGRYGADPYLNNMLTGGDWHEHETS